MVTTPSIAAQPIIAGRILQVGQSERDSLILAVLIGLAPLFGGLLFRTYQYHAEPGWYESLRQLDMPYILIELGVIFWAHARGLQFKAIFLAMDRHYRLAALLFFGTFAVGSIFFAPIPAYSMLRLSYWIIHIGFVAAVWHLVKNCTEHAIAQFAKWAVIGVAAYMPLLVLHFMLAPDPADTPLNKIIWSSAFPGCLSIRHFGIWIGGVLALWLGHIGWSSRESRLNIWNWLILTSLFALLFWSGTRGAIIAILATLGVASMAAHRLPDMKLILATTGAFIAGLALSTLGFAPDSSFGVFRFIDVGGMTADQLSSGRLETWLAVLAKWIQNPIFGWGEGSMYWNVKLSHGAHLQPHNSIVQFLFSWGIVATTAAGYVMLRLLWTLHKAARVVPQMLAPLMLVDVTLAMSLFDGALYFTRMIMPAALALAICLAMLNRKPATE